MEFQTTVKTQILKTSTSLNSKFHPYKTWFFYWLEVIISMTL